MDVLCDGRRNLSQPISGDLSNPQMLENKLEMV